MDQKPSYFNNAAATGTFGRRGKPVTVREKFAASRERYTINTSVQTYTYEGLAATAVENEAPLSHVCVHLHGGLNMPCRFGSRFNARSVREPAAD